MSAYFIIEHPTRGILKYESEVGEPHFGSSFMRNDERAYRTYSLSEAKRIRDRFTNDKTRGQCYILRSPVRDEIEWVNAEAELTKKDQDRIDFANRTGACDEWGI